MNYTEQDRGYDTPCWIWNGPVDVHGYGRANKDGRQYKAHHYAYMKENGEIPPGLVVHHKCEVKLCVNVDHLQWVTRDEHNKIHMPEDPNMRGYAARPRPQYRKVTLADVEEIRVLYEVGGISQAELGRKFGVTQTHIWRIVNNRIH